MDALHSVSVAKVAELLDLNNLTKEMNLKERAIECSDVNRPALQLSGYFDHFEERRIQIIGNVEYTYIEKMSDSEKKERYSRFMAVSYTHLTGFGAIHGERAAQEA